MSDTVIVLQDECILTASGKAGKLPKIDRVSRIPIEPFGDTFEQWKAALKEYNEEYLPKSLKIVLPASYSSARITQVPYAVGRQLSKMAKNVVDKHKGEDIADYSVVQSDKKQGVCLCCGSAQNDVIKQILDFCTELKITVKEISIPMEGYLKLLSQSRVYKNKTAIFLLFEENSVTSVLYKEGMCLYTTRSRIFSEPGTLNFGTEIVRSISGMMQFYATTKSETPITDVYYTGCLEDDFEVSIEGIKNMNLNVRKMKIDIPFQAKGDPQFWLSCIGGMIVDKKKKEINLLPAWKEANKEEVIKNVDILSHILVPLATLGVCMVLFAAVTGWNLHTQGQINDVNDWINDEQVQAAYQEANAIQQKSDKLAEAQDQVRQMTANLDTYPDLTKKMISTIENASGRDMEVHIKTMDADTGKLTFDAVSQKVIDIPTYVQKLQKTGLFASLDYTGYTYQSQEKTYSLALSCILKSDEAETEIETGGAEN